MRNYQLKPLHPEAIPRALERAHLYRLLNEPRQAESICRDILHVDPDNQEALVKMLLSLTDQFVSETANIQQVLKLLPRIRDEYEKWYYTGLAYERWAKTHHRGMPGTVAIDWYQEAMQAFEKAEAMRPPGNDDAILRWNFCVRAIRSDEQLQDKYRGLSFGGSD